MDLHRCSRRQHETALTGSGFPNSKSESQAPCVRVRSIPHGLPGTECVSETWTLRLEVEESVTEADSDNVVTDSGTRAAGNGFTVTGANMLVTGVGGGFRAKAVSLAILHDLTFVSHQRSHSL